MMISRPLDNARGFALLLVLLLSMIVGALALSAVAVFGNASLINVHAETQAEMEAIAIAGTELGRALVNRTPALYPDSGFVELPAERLTLTDAEGRPLTGYTRRIYAGPTGVATGQFGVFGSIVSIVEDGRGNRTIFRREMVQESFAKFAYFTDHETTVSNTAIYFAPGDQLFGPVHSNDLIRIMNAANGPIFHGTVTTHRYVENANRGQFRQGRQEGVGRINLPSVAQLSKLLVHAQSGQTAFTSSTVGALGEATSRIEFVAIDIDGDGSTTGENEGFLKYYRAPSTSSGARWVVASRTSPVTASPNCGHRHVVARPGTDDQYFYTAAQHEDSSVRDSENKPLEKVTAEAVLRSSTIHQRARCYLGGSDSLNTAWPKVSLVGPPGSTFIANDGRGSWQKWGGVWAAPMPPAIAARADREYLIPLGRDFNPNFKGVIHVTGHVAISGVLRGRVTLASTGDIVIADDVQYATDPASEACDDILGLFAGGDIVVSDNTINSPMDAATGSSVDYRTFDTTRDEIIHGVLLTLGSFTVANYDSGATSTEPCAGVSVGRGCLFVTGGIIQDRRGPVGQSSGSKGITGYLKRYSYDQCAASNPPPYYPTTGYFSRGRLYEVNPSAFDIAEYFGRITAG